MREYRSPTVLVTVRSLASFLRIFSYSEMAFGSLPCWTYFSALARTFCLLKPNSAIRVRTPDPGLNTKPAEREGVAPGYRFRAVISPIGGWLAGQGHCKAWVMNRMVTKGYRKGVYEWVTKGMGGRKRVPGPFTPRLVGMCYVAGAGKQCIFPDSNSWDRQKGGKRKHDLDSNCVAGGGRRKAAPRD